MNDPFQCQPAPIPDAPPPPPSPPGICIAKCMANEYLKGIPLDKGYEYALKHAAEGAVKKWCESALPYVGEVSFGADLLECMTECDKKARGGE